MLSEANFLILDEPTNHLDIASKEILEEALVSYTGTVLYVSHDRYFINQTATRIMELTNQAVVNYIGDYDYYLEKKEELTSTYAPGSTSPEAPAEEKSISENKLSWQQMKEEQAKKRKREAELKKVEARIEELETRDSEIDETMVLPDVCTNVAECTKLSREKAAIAEELEELIDDPKVTGIGEMMNFPGVVSGDYDVLAKIQLGTSHGKIVDGHAPGLLGRDLDAYLVTGITNTHECTTLEEMRENLRRGSYILIREGSAAKNLRTLLPGVTPGNARRCAFCCDDRHIEDIVSDGHMDNHLRLAVGMGMDPVQAITMCTLNAAECFGLRNKGAIAPGRDADFILVDDLKAFRVRKVFTAGRLIAEDGRVLIPLDDAAAGAPSHSIHLKPLAEDALSLPVRTGKARVIGIEPASLVTKSLVREVNTDDAGCFQSALNPGLTKIAVIERHKRTGKLGIGILEGYGLTGGAIATTISHDSHNIVVAGDNDPDMLLAVRELADMGGGIVSVHGGAIRRLPLPIAGLMTSADPQEVNAVLHDMLVAARAELGIPEDVEPFMTLSFMALPVIPELKLTARGLFNVNTFSFVGVEAD